MRLSRATTEGSSRWRRLVSVGAAAFAIAVSPSAIAAPPDEPEPLRSREGRADQLFHSGEKKFDSGDYAGACADFSASLKLGPKLGTLLNLALCHEQVGKLVTAWNEFAHGAAWAAQNNQRDRLEFAREHIRSLEPRLPRIVLSLPATSVIEAIELDGEPVPETRWYLPLYLDPGEHHLAVTAPGKKRTTVTFRVTMSPTDQLVMVPPLATDYEQLAPTTTIDPSRRTLGLGALGVSAASFALGATFGVLAATADDTSGAHTDALVATSAFVGGAAFAVIGGWLIWTSSARGHLP